MNEKRNGPSLTLLLGTPVTEANGTLFGRLKDIAVATGADAGQIAGLVLKTKRGLELVPATEVLGTPSGLLELRSVEAVQPLRGDENFILLKQDFQNLPCEFPEIAVAPTDKILKGMQCLGLNTINSRSIVRYRCK